MAIERFLIGLGMLMLGLSPVRVLAAERPAPLKVLILSGANNHDWRLTTPALKKLLEDSGRFMAEVTENPAGMTAATLAPFDLVLSNWTNYPDKNRTWGPVAEQALFDFVKGGKGLALFHAAAATFPDWPDFARLAGAGWVPGIPGKPGSGHGARHTFKVKILDRAHPIVQGLPDFYLNDELWHRLAEIPGPQVLCRAYSASDKGGTGKDEPMALVHPFGQGRVFFLVPGHDVTAMSNPAWETLMLRGAEWAATGKVTLAARQPWPSTPEAVPTAQKAAREGGRREALEGLLGKTAPTEVRKMFCRRLGLVGTTDDVPVLAGLLADKDLGEEALGALERIGGERALAAMRGALAQAQGKRRVGLINALGNRSDRQAVAPIAAHLTDADPVIVEAAIDALGKIDSQEAMDVLIEGQANVPEALRPALGGWLLRHAERLAAAGESELAAKIYEGTLERSTQHGLSQAALAGLLELRPAEVGQRVLAALTGANPTQQKAAVQFLRRHRDPALTRELLAKLPEMQPLAQAATLTALAAGGDKTALPAALKAAAGEQPDVREAALAAVGRLGDARTVAPLVRLAAGKSREAVAPIHASLMALRGKGVNVAIAAQLKRADPQGRDDLLRVLVARDARDVTPTLFALAADKDLARRAGAIRALGALADDSAIGPLSELMSRADTAGERETIAAALGQICQRAPDHGGTVKALAAAMAQATGPARGSLLRVMGALGGEEALAIVKKQAGSPEPEMHEAAIRALSDWPDATPAPALLRIAAAERDVRLQVLALRGVGDLLTRTETMPAPRKVAIIRKALALPVPDDEKKLLLGHLGRIPTAEALTLALEAMRNPALTDEATLAAVQTAEVLMDSDSKTALAGLKKVLSESKYDAARTRAQALIDSGVPLPPKTGRNLALGGKAENLDGLAKDGAAGTPQSAIDGKWETYWDEQDLQSLYWLKVTLAAPAPVACLRIVGYNQKNYAPKDFEVLCDGKVAVSVKGAIYRKNETEVLLPGTVCQTVELKITAYYGKSPAIRELAFYGPEK